MRNLNVRNLFIVACVLKVASALAGWHFNSPWFLGFVCPLAVMVAYMGLGIARRNDEVSDEKFADSCYYLGFIFTIASISVALMDLPNIGIHIQDIAVRFGAAMLSTVLGLSVRVAMVTFRKDLGDAIQNAGEGVVEASMRFRDQLGSALDRLSSFETAVDQAAKLSVERVNLQVENLSRNHADKLTQFFATLTTGNQEAFTLALDEVRTASTRLSDSVDGYAQGMQANLGSIESKVAMFSEAVTNRLKTTTFPDDYFAKHLAHPLGRLKSAADEVHGHIIGASETFGESTAVLSLALKKLRDKASSTEAALESVGKLASQQQALMDGAQGQVDKLEQLGATLQGFDAVLARTVQGLEAANENGAQLKDAVRTVVADATEARKEVREQLEDVAGELVASTASQHQNLEQVRASLQLAVETYQALAERMESSTEAMAGKLLEGATANREAAHRMATSAAATEFAAGKLETVASADVRLTHTLSTLGESATSGLKRVDAAVEQLQTIARQLVQLDSSIRTEGAELRNAAMQLAPARALAHVSTPELPPAGFSFGSPEKRALLGDQPVRPIQTANNSFESAYADAHPVAPQTLAGAEAAGVNAARVAPALLSRPWPPTGT